MKHFGKKLISVVLALMCLATIGVVSASAANQIVSSGSFVKNGQRYISHGYSNGDWAYAPVNSRGQGNGTYYYVDEQRSHNGMTPVYKRYSDSSGRHYSQYVGLKNERG